MIGYFGEHIKRLQIFYSQNRKANCENFSLLANKPALKSKLNINSISFKCSEENMPPNDCTDNVIHTLQEFLTFKGLLKVRSIDLFKMLIR